MLSKLLHFLGFRFLPADVMPMSRLLRVEKRISSVRVAVLLSTLPLTLTIMPPSDPRFPVMIVCLIVISCYILAVHFLRLYERGNIGQTSYVLSAVDCFCVQGWILISGGYESNYYPVIYLAIMSVAIRHGIRVGMLYTVFHSVVYVLICLLYPLSLSMPVVLLRVCFGFLTAALTAILTEEILASHAQISESNTLLAAEIEERVKAEHQLMALDKRKDEFIAVMSHELRNPLATMMHAIEMQRLGDLSPTMRAQVNTTLERQVVHLTSLVADLLDSARISRGLIRLQKRPLDLTRVLGEAIETCTAAIRAKQHQIVTELPEQPLLVDADRERLVQIFTNVVGNAAKYTDPGGKITIVAQQEGSQAKIQISDTGIGMASDMQGRVFEFFTQAESALSRSEGGLGIGLAVARDLVLAHGGRIACDSPGPGHGSTFTIWLPMLAHDADSKSAPSVVVPTSNGATQDKPISVLLAEDASESAQLLSFLLSAAGVEVRIVGRGDEVLSALKEKRPSLAILDIGLPGLDGCEVARLIRRDEELRDLPLIALSGYGRDQDFAASALAGFDRHLVKPVSQTVLRQAIFELANFQRSSSRATKQT